MPTLNLETKNKAQELIKAYLEENASEVLAEKINNGTPLVKDGKQLLNRKTLDGFMTYATEEARKQAENNARSACIEDSVVFGWAIHYFEEESIEGTLYNEDGSLYAPQTPVKKTVKTTTPVPAPKPQMSLFDLMEEETKEAAALEEQDEDMPSSEEIQERPAEEEQKTKEGSPIYQRYMDLQKQYPSSIVIIRLGDFYEVFGSNAVTLASELDLTLTGRDCGLSERIPVLGFPYHAADSYIRKITEKGHTVAIAESTDEVQQISPLHYPS